MMGMYGNGNGGKTGLLNQPTRTRAFGCWNSAEIKRLIDADTHPTQQDANFSGVSVLVHGNLVYGSETPINRGSAYLAGGVQFLATARARSDYYSVVNPLYGLSSFRVAQAGQASGLGVIATSPLGTGAFTLDMSVLFPSVATVQTIFDWRPFNNNGFYPTIYLNSDGKLHYYTNSADRIITASALTANTKYVVRYVKDGAGTGTLCINGSSVGTWADTGSYTAASGLLNICQSSANVTNAGCLQDTVYDEIRVTIGTARATSYTPDTLRFPDY